MRPFIARLTTVLVVSFIIVAPLAAEKFGSKYDREADFSGYETFSWQLPEKPRGPRTSDGGDLDLVIRTVVNEQLEKAGLRHQEGGEDADLHVTYDAAATPEMDLELVRYNITSNVAWVVDGGVSSYADGSTTRTFFEGTLVVSLRDAKTDQTVWSAWTSKRVKNNRNLSGTVKKLTKKIVARLPDFG